MKKTLISVLAIIFLMSLFSFSALAAEEVVIATGNSGENVTWKIIDRAAGVGDPHYRLIFSGTGELVGYNADGSLPSYSAGCNHTQFDPYKNYIYEIVVEDGITAIGRGGLSWFYNVKTIELPADLTSIGYIGLTGNKQLERISVRGNNTFLGADLSSITSLGTYAFDGCSSLRYINLNPDYEGGLNKEIFKACKSLESIVIPAGVSKLVNAFENCTSLRELVFLGDPTFEDDVFLGVDMKKLTFYTANQSGNVVTFANSNAITLKSETPSALSDFYSPDPNVIDIGKCAADVFYKLVKGDDGYCTMYTFGTGLTMSAVSVSGDSVGYYTSFLAYWYPNRSLITKVVISDNIKSMAGLACGFMPNLAQVEIPFSLTEIVGACFESSNGFGSLYMRGDTPIEGHIDFTNIKKFSSYTFDGCYGIKSIKFAEYPTSISLGTEFFKNCQNLTSVELPFNLESIGSESFEGCTSLKHLTLYSDAKIKSDSFKGCKLESIAGLSDSFAQKYAEENNITFIPPNLISVYMDNSLIAGFEVVDGALFEPQLIDEKICMLYTDESLTTPFDYSTHIYENMDVYAVTLVEHIGFMVRSEEYNGLRSIYSFNINVSGGNSLYNIKEMGSISSAERDIRGTTEMTIDDNYIFVSPVVKNNIIVGKLSSYPEGDHAEFAHTAIGYEENGILTAKNATDALYFRSYVVLENKQTGDEIELYSAVSAATLKDKAEKTLAKGDDVLSSEEKDFIGIAANAEYDRTAIYNETELMEYMNAMYEDIDHVIYGQQVSTNSVDSLANYLAMFKDETGDYPGVIGLDQVNINTADMTDEEKTVFFDDVLEYVRRGGIITLSIHLTNPKDETQGYRGELGFEDSWEELLTPNSALNLSLHTYLEDVRDTLQHLEDRNIPVLFRPLHEMNISSFWWCVNQTENGVTKVLDSQYVIRLWHYYYNYFENICDLDNLVWVYGPNYTNNTSTTSGTQNVMYAWPGDEYVEMVGCDWYTSTGDYTEIDGAGKSLSNLEATGYPVAITEFGPSGDLLPVDDSLNHPYKAMQQLEIIKNIAYELDKSIVYMLNWTGKWSIYNMGDSDEFMADPMIYGASENYDLLIAKKLG